MPAINVTPAGGSSDDSARVMMNVAKYIVAPAMRRIARIRTQKTADAVNIVNNGGWIQVRAGRPGGEWGWVPIQASMFDNNRRHPLFGDKRHWYHQGDFPITEMTEKLVARTVEDKYVQEVLPILLKRLG